MKYSTILIMILTEIACSFTVKGQEKLLMAGSYNTSIMIIDKASGSIDWRHTIEPYENGIECNSVDITDNGDILYSYKKGVKLIDLNHKVIWDYPAPAGSEIHSASVLPDDRFLIAINGCPTRIVELDKNGVIRKTIHIKDDLGNKNPHMQCRQIRKAKNGNYLIPLLGKAKLYEIDSEGNSIRIYDTKGGAFSILETSDNTLILSLGDSHCIQQICRETGKEILYIDRNDLQGCTIQFAGEITELDNGHLMLANWSGHETDKRSPQLIEFDLAGNVYWTLKGEKYGYISTCHPINKNIIR